MKDQWLGRNKALRIQHLLVSKVTLSIHRIHVLAIDKVTCNRMHWLLVFLLCISNTLILLHQISRSSGPTDLGYLGNQKFSYGTVERDIIGHGHMWIDRTKNPVSEAKKEASNINSRPLGDLEIHTTEAGSHRQSNKRAYHIEAKSRRATSTAGLQEFAGFYTTGAGLHLRCRKRIHRTKN